MNLFNESDPSSRELFINDFLKQKGIYQSPKPLREEEVIMKNALVEWNSIWKGSILPLLKALKSPSDYNSAGTQRLLLDAFKSKFNKWDKESMTFLISVMHTEEMEKQARQLAEQGIIGENMNKPI